MKQPRLTKDENRIGYAYFYEKKSIQYIADFMLEAKDLGKCRIKKIILQYIETQNSDNEQMMRSDYEEKSINMPSVNGFKELFKNDQSITIRDAYPHYFTASQTTKKFRSRQTMPAYMGV